VQKEHHNLDGTRGACVVGLFKHLVRGFESRSRLDERPRLSIVLPFVDRGIMICGRGSAKHLKDLVEPKGCKENTSRLDWAARELAAYLLHLMQFAVCPDRSVNPINVFIVDIFVKL
jgi:hypothetical protein